MINVYYSVPAAWLRLREREKRVRAHVWAVRVRGACCAPLSFMIAELFYFCFVLCFFFLGGRGVGWFCALTRQVKAARLRAGPRAAAAQRVCVCVRMFAWICRNAFSALSLSRCIGPVPMNFCTLRIVASLTLTVGRLTAAADCRLPTTDWGVVSSARVWAGWVGLVVVNVMWMFEMDIEACTATQCES